MVGLNVWTFLTTIQFLLPPPAAPLLGGFCVYRTCPSRAFNILLPQFLPAPSTTTHAFIPSSLLLVLAETCHGHEQQVCSCRVASRWTDGFFPFSFLSPLPSFGLSPCLPLPYCAYTYGQNDMTQRCVTARILVQTPRARTPCTARWRHCPQHVHTYLPPFTRYYPNMYSFVVRRSGQNNLDIATLFALRVGGTLPTLRVVLVVGSLCDIMMVLLRFARAARARRVPAARARRTCVLPYFSPLRMVSWVHYSFFFFDGL